MGISPPGLEGDIVETGLGGYVIGRSAEKVLPGLVEATKKGSFAPRCSCHFLCYNDDPYPPARVLMRVVDSGA